MDESKDVTNRAHEGKVHEFPRQELVESCEVNESSVWQSAAEGISRGVAGLAMARIFHPTIARKIELRLQAIEIERLIQRVLHDAEDDRKAA